MIYKNALEMIGGTPIVRLAHLEEEGMAELYIKLEGKNPGGSIKDRAALGMIEEAERLGEVKMGSVIIEPTSGNTGIAIALIGRLKGYRVIITMPDTMSVERRSILKAYGAEIVLTDGAKGMKGAIDKADELATEIENSFVPQQFKNKANPEKHYRTTAEEILADLPELDAFVAGVGTGGTITGVGGRLKESSQKLKIYAVEPTTSAVLSGEGPGKHRIQGIGAGFIPEIVKTQLIDEVVKVADEEAFEASRRTASMEGLLLGISSGANIAAAIRVAKELGEGKKVLTVSPDGGEKYLSTDLYR
ncbi:cysteine synthase [Propionigenium maris DSM 9537]|uniref:Cysteine synthase n=1 Tax=Propionigenium maris DSM 9537 TaxID=1123000 RepID=A0A9W6GMC6_9FUSO|nr:cysteine synthase A [Propionigenium maris]GLI56217.1 cysteine synthase [Propionigenium maris DSM 9537]